MFGRIMWYKSKSKKETTFMKLVHLTHRYTQGQGELRRGERA